jgi:dihydrofolate reductase
MARGSATRKGKSDADKAEGAARRVVYGCAMSLDGYIAARDGGYDWIVHDPEMDFAAMFARFDTFLIGRKTYDVMKAGGRPAKTTRSILNVVFSRAMKPTDDPNVTISNDAESFVRELRSKPGKEIALFGGGELFQSLLAAGLVDGVEVSVIPVLLGGGIPLVPSPSPQTKLKLRKHRLYEKTGIIGLEYDVVHG